jgi:hypothetical protein
VIDCGNRSSKHLVCDLVDRPVATLRLGLKTLVCAAWKSDRVVSSSHSQSVGTAWVDIMSGMGNEIELAAK